MYKLILPLLIITSSCDKSLDQFVPPNNNGIIEYNLNNVRTESNCRIKYIEWNNAFIISDTYYYNLELGHVSYRSLDFIFDNGLGEKELGYSCSSRNQIKYVVNLDGQLCSNYKIDTTYSNYLRIDSLNMDKKYIRGSFNVKLFPDRPLNNFCVSDTFFKDFMMLTIGEFQGYFDVD